MTDQTQAVAEEILKFTQAHRQGHTTSDAAQEFLTDANNTGRIDTALRTALQSTLHGEKLSHRQLAHLVSLMEESRDQTMAKARDHRTLSHWAMPNPDTKLQLALLEKAINQAGTRLILDSAASWPPKPPETPGRDTGQSAAQAALNVLAPLMQDGHNGAWTNQIRALDLVDTELAHYSLTGEPPAWFIPSEMTVTPEAARQGYSIVNPGSMPLHDPGMLAEYIARRMELFLKQDEDTQKNQPASLEHQVSALTFGDLMVSPFTDWNLAGHRGPGDRRLPNHTRIPPELQVTDRPAQENHARLSYRIALQEHLTPLDLQRSIAAKNARALALHVIGAANTMPKLSIACRQLPGKMNRHADAVRKALPRYQPIATWDAGPEENLQRVNTLTTNMSQPEILREKIHRNYESLVLLHLADTLERRADGSARRNRMTPEDRLYERERQVRSTVNSLFGAQLLTENAPGDRQGNEPEIILIIQGLTALHHAQEALGQTEKILDDATTVPWDPEEKEQERTRTAQHAANVLAHADWCIIAGHLLLNLHNGPEQPTLQLQAANA